VNFKVSHISIKHKYFWKTSIAQVTSSVSTSDINVLGCRKNSGGLARRVPADPVIYSRTSAGSENHKPRKNGAAGRITYKPEEEDRCFVASFEQRFLVSRLLCNVDSISHNRQNFQMSYLDIGRRWILLSSRCDPFLFSYKGANLEGIAHNKTVIISRASSGVPKDSLTQLAVRRSNVYSCENVVSKSGHGLLLAGCSSSIPEHTDSCGRKLEITQFLNFGDLVQSLDKNLLSGEQHPDTKSENLFGYVWASADLGSVGTFLPQLTSVFKDTVIRRT
jgi:hypothetical protein